MKYPDGGWFEYEPATGRWHVRGIKSMVIEAADNITLKTGEFVVKASNTHINIEVVNNSGVTHGGGAMSSNGILVDKHGQIGVKSGGDTIHREVLYDAVYRHESGQWQSHF